MTAGAGRGVLAGSVPALLLAVGLALAGWFVGDGLTHLHAGDRYVTVKGLAQREVPADLAVWPITFAEVGDDLPTVSAHLDADAKTVRGFLDAHGLAAAQLVASPPQIDDHAAQSGPSHPRYRYRAQQTLTLRSGDVQAVKQAMQAAGDLVKAGVAFVQYGPQPQFLFTRLNQIKPALIAEATRNARLAAEQFARDSGSRVGAIRSASQGQIVIRDRDPSSPDVKIVRVVSTLQYFLRGQGRWACEGIGFAG
jgi:Uncharacterized protein conserved in bacteria